MDFRNTKICRMFHIKIYKLGLPKIKLLNLQQTHSIVNSFFHNHGKDVQFEFFVFFIRLFGYYKVIRST